MSLSAELLYELVLQQMAAESYMEGIDWASETE